MYTDSDCTRCTLSIWAKDVKEKCEKCTKELNDKRYDVGVMDPCPLPRFSGSQIMETEAKKKESKDWIQKAVTPEEKGKFTDWCKKRGYKGVGQTCINEAISAGGSAAQMANFAINVSKGKYKHQRRKKLN